VIVTLLAASYGHTCQRAGKDIRNGGGGAKMEGSVGTFLRPCLPSLTLNLQLQLPTESRYVWYTV